MRVLIVDDEPMARQVLRELVEDLPGVEVAGEAASGTEALDRLEKLDPDVLLIDQQMPGLSGLSLARALRGGRRPLLIFVTAYQEHAVEAFEVGVVDYLLKPVRQERLAIALRRAGSQLAQIREPQPPTPGRQRIVGRLRSDLYLLDAEEVIAFHAEGEVVQIVTADKRFYSPYTLRALETRLPRPQFRRVHRKTIINTHHIRKISPLSSKRWLVTMSNGLEAIVSKRLAGVIREETRW